MGEMADLVLAGGMCQECGEMFDDEPGYPRTCEACQPSSAKRPPRGKPMARTVSAQSKAKTKRK